MPLALVGEKFHKVSDLQKILWHVRIAMVSSSYPDLNPHSQFSRISASVHPNVLVKATATLALALFWLQTAMAI